MILLTALVISFLPIQNPTPPDSITLQYCYQSAYKNYPTAKNIELQRKITALNVRIARSGYFPQITAKGKATYQSEVTSFSSSSGQGPPPASKDQYSASLHAVQTIFNAGKVGVQIDLQQARGAKKKSNNESKIAPDSRSG